MKFQDSSFNGLKVTVGTKSVTHAPTHARTHPPTHAPKAICPINFFKVGGIKRGGGCRCRGLDLTKNHLKMEKKTKKEEKKKKKNLGSERDLNTRPSDYKSCT